MGRQTFYDCDVCGKREPADELDKYSSYMQAELPHGWTRYKIETRNAEKRYDESVGVICSACAFSSKLPAPLQYVVDRVRKTPEAK